MIKSVVFFLPFLSICLFLSQLTVLQKLNSSSAPNDVSLIHADSPTHDLCDIPFFCRVEFSKTAYGLSKINYDDDPNAPKLLETTISSVNNDDWRLANEQDLPQIKTKLSKNRQLVFCEKSLRFSVA